MVQSVVDLVFNTTLIITAVIFCSGGDPLKEPVRVDVCLVASGADAEDVSTWIWSDQIERYFAKYPNSYCGKCGDERKCPEN